MRRVSVALGLVFLLAALVAIPVGALQHAAHAQSLQGSGTLYIVALGDFPAEEVEQLPAYYEERFGVSIEVLPPVALDASAIDAARQQGNSAAVAELVSHHYPALARDPRSVVLALTTVDMYIPSIDWQFAFPMRASYSNGSRFALVSNARMDPVFHGERPDPALRHVRTRKMLTKQIGLLYFGLSTSANPQSVLFTPLSLDELDAMGEDF